MAFFLLSPSSHSLPLCPPISIDKSVWADGTTTTAIKIQASPFSACGYVQYVPQWRNFLGEQRVYKQVLTPYSNMLWGSIYSINIAMSYKLHVNYFVFNMLPHSRS